jgi:hypothetical protein
MKARITNASPRVGQCFIILVAISIACSASKSASSPAPVSANQPANQLVSPTPASVTTSSVHERTACTLKLSELPAINRLRFGMTEAEVLAVFPGSKDDAELRTALSKPRGPLGNSSFLLTPSKYTSPADYKDVSRVNFSMLDGRVSSFTINYNGPEWPNIDKFVEKFVEGKDLPAVDQWEPYAGMENQMKTLTCTDFSIRVFSGGEGGNQNYVLVQDLEADKKLKERRRKARESASPSPGL